MKNRICGQFLTVLSIGMMSTSAAVAQSIGDDLDYWPSEDEQIRQRLKERLNGKKDSEYRAVFERKSENNWKRKRRRRGEPLEQSGTFQFSIPPANKPKNTIPTNELYGDRSRPYYIALSSYVSAKLEPCASLIERGKYDEALRALNNFNANTPRELTEAQYMRALLNQSIGNFEDAAKQFDAVRNNSRDANLRSKAELGLKAIQNKRKFIAPEQLHLPSSVEEVDESADKQIQ